MDLSTEPVRPVADGLIILDKSAGMRSARAVSEVQRLLPRGTRIGHGGTLDPFATGVLVLLVGRATRRCEQIMGLPKAYEAEIKLGATTATDDPDSAEQPTVPPPRPPTRAEIEAALGRFVGEIQQRPPVFSAIKLGGKRACDRVRAGQRNIVLQPRTVHVYGIELLSYEWPIVRTRIRCGRGTYIRSIARDLGAALGVGGYVRGLRRMSVGEYSVANAVRLDQLNASNVLNHLLGPPDAAST